MQNWNEICDRDGHVLPHQVAYLRRLADPRNTCFGIQRATGWMLENGLVEESSAGTFTITALGRDALRRIDEAANPENTMDEARP